MYIHTSQLTQALQAIAELYNVPCNLNTATSTELAHVVSTLGIEHSPETTVCQIPDVLTPQQVVTAFTPTPLDVALAWNNVETSTVRATVLNDGSMIVPTANGFTHVTDTSTTVYNDLDALLIDLGLVIPR